MFQCGVLLDEVEFRKFGASKDIQNYDRSFIWQKLQSFVCPGSCYEVFTIDDEIANSENSPCLESISCSNCLTAICGKCKGKNHGEAPCPSTRESNLLSFLLEGGAELELQWTSCPVCKQAILRDSGCNHMTCLCHKEFCFYCRRRWTPQSPNHHADCPVSRGNDIFAKGVFPLHLLSTLPTDPVAWETFGIAPILAQNPT